MNNVPIFSHCSFISKDELVLFLNKISDRSNPSILDKVKDGYILDERLKILTGHSAEQLKSLEQMLTSMRNTDTRSVHQALFVFLLKLRSGNSNNLISSVLDIKHDQTVSDYCKAVLYSFEKDVLPTKFGVNSCTREDLINNHTSPYIKKLLKLENQLVLIADGTYLRHEKSTNNYYQRKSYSGQKKVNLCKPFTLCTTDGFVVDTFGPYLGTQNDAQIMKIILSDPNGLRKLLKKGDVFILDRGFRDIKADLEKEGFIVLMPALKWKRKQLSVLEANESRFVTKFRWVVEAVHGQIGSKFKLLHNQLDNKLLPTAAVYCKTACFLINIFGKRLIADVGMQDEISDYMLSMKNSDNMLAKEIEEGNWNRKKLIFKELTSVDIDDFPEITEHDLKVLLTGTYQLSQSVSYLAELVSEDGRIYMHYLIEDKGVLKCEVKSRHINRKVYKCYVHYEPNSVGRNGIKNYACDCANGLRTVGCCSHIVALIYYLSYGRYLSEIIRPAKILNDLFSVEQTEPVIDEDSDED